MHSAQLAAALDRQKQTSHLLSNSSECNQKKSHYKQISFFQHHCSNFYQLCQMS